MTFYILSYNNYYNRLVKQESNLNGYLEYVVNQFENINFNPNNNIDTTHIVGQGDYNGAGNYVLIVDEFGEIVSRWFIIEAQRTRAGQWQLTLHRDLVVDYYNIISEAPIFIEKSIIDYNNPLIYNKENVIVNQIKKRETALKDPTNSAWLVGYCAKDMKELSGTVEYNLNEDMGIIPVSAQSIENWEFYQYINNGLIAPTNQTFITFYYGHGQNSINYINQYQKVVFNTSTGNVTVSVVTATNVKLYKTGTQLRAQDFKTSFINHGLANFDISAFYTNLGTSQKVNDLNFFNGKVIKTGDGKFYQVQVTSESYTSSGKAITKNSGLANALLNSLGSMGMIVASGGIENNTFTCGVSSVLYKVKIQERADLAISYTLKESPNKLITEDAPWDLFAIPYGEVRVKGTVANSTFDIYTDKIVGLNTLMQISIDAVTGSAGNIYDIQLLPYCPIPSLIDEDGTINLTTSKQYSTITNGGNVKSVILYAPNTTFNTRIANIIQAATTSIDRKLNNECDLWRLCSPDYSNYFDFSVEKNNGVNYFDVDCTYKPFTPYIHINPNFKNLYGADYNDPRGLILGSNFSLAQISDAWQQYELQNKNYDAAFKRQLTNMDINHKYQEQQDIINASVGTMQGAATGAFIGGASGGLGGLIGGLAGGAISGAAGAQDVWINNQLRNEQKSYAIDQYNFQLGNIQALPNTLTKVDAFTPNNKIFPVLEYYTCTDEERDAVRNQIIYHGMTTMAIGKMSDYSNIDTFGNGYGDFFKGRIIRLDALTGVDNNIANAISTEINKGVFI